MNAITDRIYIQFADNGNIRKWQRDPFEGGAPYLASLPSDDEVGLIERLNNKAGMIEMGERIAWGSDSALMREAAALLQSQAAELAAVNEALTPSGATKAEYIGEFFEQVEIGNPDFDDDDDAPETIMQRVPVSWTTIKAIMAAIARRAHSKDGGERNG